MSSYPVNVGIVGLGRWAKVLTRAAVKSDKLKIVAGYSRSQEKRNERENSPGEVSPRHFHKLVCMSSALRSGGSLPCRLCTKKSRVRRWVTALAAP